MTPKHLDRIKAITESGLLTLNGNRMLIELLEEAEQTTKSGIITSVNTNKFQAAADRARIAVVLATGPGYVVEKEVDGVKVEENVDMPFKAGDYILVNQFGAKTFGDFFGIAEYRPDSIGLITDDLVQGRISDLAQFQSILKS